ncbi:MAG: glutamate 5-kinase [Candidatus Caenarcaniphilales bacterium]|nr:glutamate 5-kinase [Candidatus Caenarcaniphilales bacterium]
MLKNTIVIKIGTASITAPKTGVDLLAINNLARTAAELKSQRHRVMIVSSGAMSLGIKKLALESNSHSDNSSFKQALTAVGQVDLMNAYENIFQYYGYHVGQVLTTHQGLEDQSRYESIHNTLENLFELDVIPVINANDPVTPSEIDYGDNDCLSAKIAVLAKANYLVLVTDSGALYDSDPRENPDAKLISKVTEINDEILAMAGTSSSNVGMGGMKSKIEAAQICLEKGIKTLITGKANIEKLPESNFELESLEALGTLFY